MSAESVTPSERREAVRYFQVSPTGAFYATLSPDSEPMRMLLLQVLSSDIPVPHVPQLLGRLTGLSQESAERLLEQMQARGLLSLVEKPLPVAAGALEKVLPELLAPLGENKVMLADQQGFALANSGFGAEEAEAVAGMAGDLMALGDRHQRLIDTHLELSGCSWALVNAVGQSELGFWVLCVGREKFVLVIEGMPYLNRQPFVDLASLLIRRYLDT